VRIKALACLASLKRRVWQRGWFRCAAATCALVFAAYATRHITLPAVARFLDVSDPPSRTEYVMVLGGGPQTRPFVAAALVRCGFADRVLLAAARESWDQREGVALADHEVCRRVLVKLDVPEESVIVLPGECASTYDEAQALAEFARRHPLSTFTVVTSSYHTRRTRYIFRKALGELASQVQFLGAPNDGFDETNWWRDEAGFAAYTSECLKLVFYLLRY
jgi:uncharacterized SAM-binding protein YcdF (DUF218 family)